MRGVPSMGLEIESWHLLSTWIPRQASCICGFIYMPSTLLLKAPALADPSAWNILPPDLHMVSAPGSSCHRPCPQHGPLPPPALGFSLAWVTMRTWPVQLAVCSSTEYNSKRLEGLKHPSVVDW